jgi:hypothetical protein
VLHRLAAVSPLASPSGEGGALKARRWGIDDNDPPALRILSRIAPPGSAFRPRHPPLAGRDWSLRRRSTLRHARSPPRACFIVSRRIAPESCQRARGQRGTDRPRPLRKMGSVSAPRRGDILEPRTAAYHQWLRRGALQSASYPAAMRIPSQAGGLETPEGARYAWRGVRAWRSLFANGPIRTAPPRAPHPHPEKQTVCSSRPLERGMGAFYGRFGGRA